MRHCLFIISTYSKKKGEGKGRLCIVVMGGKRKPAPLFLFNNRVQKGKGKESLFNKGGGKEGGKGKFPRFHNFLSLCEAGGRKKKKEGENGGVVFSAKEKRV